MRKDQNRRNIEKDTLFVHAVPGSELRDCLDDCIVLCIENQIDVELTHNEKAYLISLERLREAARLEKQDWGTE